MLWKSEYQMNNTASAFLSAPLLRYALGKSPICTWQTAMSVRESSRPLGDLRMQRRYWSYWAAPESLGMDLPDRVFPANRVANIAAVDAVDIRLWCLPTSASAEASVKRACTKGAERGHRLDAFTTMLASTTHR